MVMIEPRLLSMHGDDARKTGRSAPQYNNPRLNRPYFSAVSQAEFSDVLNGKDFSIQAIMQPNTTKLRRDENDHSFSSYMTMGLPSAPDEIIPSICSKVPLISEDDFVSLSLQALQGISSFLYNVESVSQRHMQNYDFVLLGRSATSLSKYQFAFSESFFIRLLLGSAQEAFSTLSADRKSINDDIKLFFCVSYLTFQ